MKDDKAVLLRDRYLKKLVSQYPPGLADVENLRQALIKIDGLCKSLVKEGLSDREKMISAIKAFLGGAAKGSNLVQPITELFGSYIRERVALVSPEQASIFSEDIFSPIQTSSHVSDTAKNQSLVELREQFLVKMLSVQRPGRFQQEQDVRRCIDDLDRSSDVLLRSKSSVLMEASLRGAQAAFQSAVENNQLFDPFINLLTSYIQERVTTQIETERVFSESSPRLIVQSLIIPGDKTKTGTLVKGVSRLWFEIMQRIRENPDSIHDIDCWKWEEFLAGAYKQDGWEVVTLTPKRGDNGIDVIAERTGLGQLRFLLLDQMKAYNPDHRVGPDEIREMKGALMDYPEATKALITTTADFTPGALEASKTFFPRLELRARDELLAWLASIALGKQDFPAE